MQRVSVSLMTILAGSMLSAPALAQNPIDSSKPTNFYSLVENNLEFRRVDASTNLWGYRGNFTFALNEANLLLAEVPILHNTRTDKTGIGDLRARYFYLPYKDYAKFFGAFGPSVDVFMPTGDFDDGLGSSSWIFSPGVTVGLMLADWIQAFPILSYTYTSKPGASSIPNAQKSDKHGLSLQAIVPIVFSETFFVQFTPKFDAADIGDKSGNRYVQELLAVYSLTPTLQLSGFWGTVFEDDDHTFRVGLTTFF